jgi:hypothetical protein
MSLKRAHAPRPAASLDPEAPSAAAVRSSMSTGARPSWRMRKRGGSKTQARPLAEMAGGLSATADRRRSFTYRCGPTRAGLGCHRRRVMGLGRGHRLAQCNLRCRQRPSVLRPTPSSGSAELGPRSHDLRRHPGSGGGGGPHWYGGPFGKWPSRTGEWWALNPRPSGVRAPPHHAVQAAGGERRQVMGLSPPPAPWSSTALGVRSSRRAPATGARFSWAWRCMPSSAAVRRSRRPSFVTSTGDRRSPANRQARRRYGRIGHTLHRLAARGCA